MIVSEDGRTKALCAWAYGPDGHVMVDCAVSRLRMPNTVLDCVCVPELRAIEQDK